ncbi:hypothetical protein P9112_003177 [Eukaryota sp. TZLM1-RC]
MIAHDTDFQKRVALRLQITPKDFVSEVKISECQEVKYWTGYRALNHTEELLFGTNDANFQLLSAFKAEVLQSHADAMWDYVKCQQTSRSQRLFPTWNGLNL